ncbi:MAG: hypothetical protein CMJ18_04880 [Phycisphaeraceae bacterium]|nr:hypothetical protein [Phycisphaeraceae bacterium]
MSNQMAICTGAETKLWETDEWSTLVVMAALSAEPESFDELEEAVRRYRPGRLAQSGRAVDDLSAIATERSWCVIDIVGRTMASGAGFGLPQTGHAYEAEGAEADEGFRIVWLDLPNDWKLMNAAGADWRTRIEQRSREATARTRLEARAVLLGLPLLEFIAEGIVRTDSNAASSAASFADPAAEARSVHTDWLMTAREDLDGHTPRALLLADHERLQRDLEHRAEQWFLQGHAPVGLVARSAAYRFGGFSLTEIVVYYDLVRSLIHEAQARRDRSPGTGRAEIVERLATHRDRWLAAPYEPESINLSAHDLVEMARRRIPLIADDDDVIDDDCPLCRMGASGALGPGFMWLDGHRLELEGVFAFSTTTDYETWRSEQDELEAFVDRDLGADESEPSAADTDPFEAPIWESSFVDRDQIGATGMPAKVAQVALGFPLAELVSDIRHREGGRAHLDALNAAYSTLAAAQDPVARESAARQLVDRLELVAEAFADLVSKSADLQSMVDQVMREDGTEE